MPTLNQLPLHSILPIALSGLPLPSAQTLVNWTLLSTLIMISFLQNIHNSTLLHHSFDALGFIDLVFLLFVLEFQDIVDYFQLISPFLAVLVSFDTIREILFFSRCAPGSGFHHSCPCGRHRDLLVGSWLFIHHAESCCLMICVCLWCLDIDEISLKSPGCYWTRSVWNWFHFFSLVITNGPSCYRIYHLWSASAGLFLLLFQSCDFDFIVRLERWDPMGSICVCAFLDLRNRRSFVRWNSMGKLGCIQLLLFGGMECVCCHSFERVRVL